MKWVALFLIVLNCYKSNAQPFQYKLYSTKEGLSSNKINTIVKDDKGLIWIATQRGLNRFDGNSFDVFYNNPTDTTSIGSNYVQSLFISTKKRLWIGTESGLSTFNPTTQQFSNYAPDTLALPKQSEYFLCINEDSDGNIWLGSRYDLLLFNPNTKKFKSSGWANYIDKVKPTNGNHSRVIILSIVKKNSNEFWVLSSYGLFSVNAQNLEFTYYPYPLFEDYFGSAISYVDEQNNLWISTYNRGILFFNTATLKFENYNLPKKIISQAGWDNCNSIDVYNKDTLIIAANKSIVFFDKGTKKFTSYIMVY
jgi:ligand-binding sensor domain-containing protein